jgi:uncharacterized membrane protein
MSDKQPHPVGTMGTGRIEALSDGVFAIIMTLLVFEITIPSVPPQELPAALISLWPYFVGYAISFVLLGIYWTGHRAQYIYILHADTNLHWLNMLFFSLCGLVPFSTGLVSRYPEQPLSVVFYGLNLALIGVALYLHWLYATHDSRLVADDLTPLVRRFGAQRCLLAPAIYVVAIAVGLVNPTISLLVYALVPIFYILPSFQRLWLRLARQ